MTFCWWPFLDEQNFLMAHYFVHITPMFNLFSLSTTSFGPSLYSSDFNGQFYLLLPGDLFLTWYCLWLHVYVPLVTYSVHMPPLGKLFCTYGSFWSLFCTYTSPYLAYSLQVPRLHSYSYTSDFCGLFLFSSPWAISYRDRARTSGDLFCTHTSTGWPILYIWNFLMAFCIHTSPTPRWSATTSWVRFNTIAFYGQFCIFTSSWWAFVIYIRTFPWWPILYTCPPLVTFSIHRKHFCTLLIFMGYFVYLLLLGEPIFTWEIFYDNVHVLLVIYSVHTHTYHEDLYSNDFNGLYHLFLPGVHILLSGWPILYI